MTFLASENPATTLPSGIAVENVGFDVNQYVAPIVTAALTVEEIAVLQKTPDIAAIENDGPMSVSDDPSSAENLPLDGHPVAQVETIPAGVARLRRAGTLPVVYCRNRLRLFDQVAYRFWHLFVARSATQWPHLSLTGQDFATRERSAGTGVLGEG